MAALGRALSRRRGPARWALALLLGALWWWAAVRLAVHPDRSGPVEGALVLGGWGLSLLPVHCVPRPAHTAVSVARERVRADGLAAVRGWHRRLFGTRP